MEGNTMDQAGGLYRKHAAFGPARQDQLGFKLLSPLRLGEEPFPPSLQTGFSITQPDPFLFIGAPVHFTELEMLPRYIYDLKK